MICEDWVNNVLFTEFVLVTYIPLHMPKLRVAEDLEELLDYHIHFCSNEDIDGIWESQGEKVLFILDGWDELPLLCRHPDSFLPWFINGTSFQNVMSLSHQDNYQHLT